MNKYHNHARRIESGIVECIIGLIGMKRRMEKKIKHNRFRKDPAPVLRSIYKNHTVQTEEHNGRSIWTLLPGKIQTDKIILFFHGGAYYANITKHHWRFIEQLLISTNAGIIVPDYPLAPESNCLDVYTFVDAVYTKLISVHPEKQFVLMGDSAGGGLALGYAQSISNLSIKQPEQIIMFSPWLDISMSNPDLWKFDKSDKILSINALKTAGKTYAGDVDVKDFHVSPIYGDFSNIGNITVFCGTNDVLISDARKLNAILKINNLSMNYFEYPGMFHDWVIFPGLREAQDVIQKTKDLITTDNN